MKRINSEGFASPALYLILVLLIGVGGVSWYVYGNQQNETTNNKSTDSENTKTTQAQESASNNLDKIGLLSEKITFELPKDFKIISGGYDQLNGACGQAMEAASCLDSVALNPADIPFTNPDQFNITIGVFDSNGTKDVRKWYEEYLGAVNGGENTFTELTINANPAIYEFADYSKLGTKEAASNEIRLGYGILGEKYGVLVSATLYKGEHRSDKNLDSINYHVYKSTVEQIARSVVVSE